jgi:hypothetical protein
MSTFTFVSENDIFSTGAATGPPQPPTERYRKNFRWGGYVAPDQNNPLNARSTAAEVPISHLKITPKQRQYIAAMYHLASGASFPTPPIVDHIYGLGDDAQLQASDAMAQYHLDAESRGSLENRWSHQWSRRSGKDIETRKILYLCACGYNRRQRNTTHDRSEHDTAGTQERQTVPPFTGCLVHAELTVRGNKILRIRGHFEHNEECIAANISRQPPMSVASSVYAVEASAPAVHCFFNTET